MTWNDYLDYTHAILSNPSPAEPYNNAEYLEYTKMNEARMKRWLRTEPILQETKDVIAAIATPQNWVLITEPWCGDAAHITPIIYLMSQLNPNIHLDIQLRDTDSEIDNYLTNGTKSIPVVIVRDAQGRDLFHWSSRPAAAQQIWSDLKAQGTPVEDIKLAIQKFYNEDKAVCIQQELISLLKKNIHSADLVPSLKHD